VIAIIKGIEQGSDEWKALRIGVFTATDAQAIANNGKGLDTLCIEKASEILTGVSCEVEYDNPDMARGRELEADARNAFEFATGLTVEQVSFVRLNEYAGCSPDGLVGHDETIEIKCPNNKNYLLLLMKGIDAIDAKHIWQMQYQMYITGRKACHYIAYNPNFQSRKLTILKIERNVEYIEKIKAGLESAVKKTSEILNMVGK